MVQSLISFDIHRLIFSSQEIFICFIRFVIDFFDYVWKLLRKKHSMTSTSIKILVDAGFYYLEGDFPIYTKQNNRLINFYLGELVIAAT